MGEELDLGELWAVYRAVRLPLLQAAQRKEERVRWSQQHHCVGDIVAQISVAIPTYLPCGRCRIQPTNQPSTQTELLCILHVPFPSQ